MPSSSDVMDDGDHCMFVHAGFENCAGVLLLITTVSRAFGDIRNARTTTSIESPLPALLPDDGPISTARLRTWRLGWL
jgi:hypothetical protein